MNKALLLLSSSVLLSGCFATGLDFSSPKAPENWQGKAQIISEASDLKSWWLKFDDPALNQLVDLSLSDSPDRLAAEARILEARGLRRSARSSLFPQLGASASASREDNGFSPIDDFHDARFDASYEVDVFGKNRKNVSAADAQIEAAEARYHDVTLTLVADVIRSYIDYRTFQKQTDIAKKNLVIQQKTLELIRQQRAFGEAPQLDVERAENLVNTTQASIPEFQRLSDNARLQLSVLTGQLPADIIAVLSGDMGIPGSRVEPVLMAPAKVIALRPDIQAAHANLMANTALAESVTAELFPTFTLSGFFGATETAFASSTSIWSIAAGAAVSILDFGRIEGRIDAARGRELEAYQLYRRTVLEAVTEVETALNDTARIDERYISLNKAYQNADKALHLSETLYKEGEVSFLDVLDAQRTVNEAESQLVSAQAAQVESLVRLYKSLGIY